MTRAETMTKIPFTSDPATRRPSRFGLDHADSSAHEDKQAHRLVQYHARRRAVNFLGGRSSRCAPLHWSWNGRGLDTAPSPRAAGPAPATRG
jgi:hypothetical protein